MKHLISPELNKLLVDFIINFELVFKNDWDFTKGIILEDFYIKDNGSFLEPGVDDESNNWANRGLLLESFRKLREFLLTQELEFEP